MNVAAISFAVPSTFFVILAIVSNIRYNALKEKHKKQLKKEYSKGYKQGIKNSSLKPKFYFDDLTGLIYPVENS